MKKPIKITLILWAIFALFFIHTTDCLAESMRLSPLKVDVSCPPGGKAEFSFSLSNPDKKSQSYANISLVDITQTPECSFRPVEKGNSPISCASWIKLSEEGKVRLAPGETKEIKGVIMPPRRVRGFRSAAIVCELAPSRRPTKTGVSLVYRIIGLIHLHITGPRASKKAEISDIKIHLEEEKLFLMASIRNSGEDLIEPEVNAHITCEKGGILGNIPLKARRNLVYPGSTVNFKGVASKRLAPGSYMVKATTEYGERMRAYATKRFSIEAELIRGASLEKVHFLIEPPVLELNVPAGGFRTAFLTIYNQEDKSIHLQGYFKDFEFQPDGKIVFLKAGENKSSCANWLNLNPSNFELREREDKKIKISVQVPKESEAEHYAKLFFKIGSSTEELPGPTIFVVTSRNIKKKAEISDFVINQNDEQLLKLIVSFKNTGNVHLRCKGEITIKDYRGVVDKISTKETEFVLPDAVRNFALNYNKKLPPGNYVAEATIDYGGKTPARLSKEFVVNIDNRGR